MGLPTGFETTHGEADEKAAAAQAVAEPDLSDGVNVGPVIHQANAEDFHDGVGSKLVQFAFDAFPQLKWSKNKFRGEAHLGRLRVNGRMAGANQRLAEGDEVCVHKEKIAKQAASKGVNSKVRARLEAEEARAAAAGAGGEGGKVAAPDEAFSENMDADGRCTKRRRGITCGCPDCATLTDAEKKKIKNRKKKEAQERKKQRLAEEAAFGGGGGAAVTDQSGEATGAAAAPATGAAAAPSAAAAVPAAAPAAAGGTYPTGWRFGGRSAPTEAAPLGVPYYHAPTGATSWDPPVHLPDGWSQSVDPSSCRSWYEKSGTAEKSWTPPEGSRVCSAPAPGSADVPAAAAAAAASSAAAVAAPAAGQALTARSGATISAAAAAASKWSAAEISEADSGEESEMEEDEDGSGAVREGVAKTTARKYRSNLTRS